MSFHLSLSLMARLVTDMDGRTILERESNLLDQTENLQS